MQFNLIIVFGLILSSCTGRRDQQVVIGGPGDTKVKTTADEMIFRQQQEKERQEKELQDIRRQEYYDQKYRDYIKGR